MELQVQFCLVREQPAAAFKDDVWPAELIDTSDSLIADGVQREMLAMGIKLMLQFPY